MAQLYLSPFWGQVDCLKKILACSGTGYHVVVCGGYLHFSNNLENPLHDLIKLRREYPNIILAKTRFEEEFMISADLAPERNYHFKRWVNPFSGIFSCITAYGLSIEDYLGEPDVFSNKLNQKILSEKHENFFNELKEGLIPEKVLNAIDASIHDQRAFREVYLFDSDGQVKQKWDLPPGLLQDYLKHSQSVLKGFINEH